MGKVFKNLCLGAWVVVLALLMNSTLPPQQVEWHDENNNPHQETVAQNKYAMCGVFFPFGLLAGNQVPSPRLNEEVIHHSSNNQGWPNGEIYADVYIFKNSAVMLPKFVFRIGVAVTLLFLGMVFTFLGYVFTATQKCLQKIPSFQSTGLSFLITSIACPLMLNFGGFAIL